jgi:hypothetical protein
MSYRLACPNVGCVAGTMKSSEKIKKSKTVTLERKLSMSLATRSRTKRRSAEVYGIDLHSIAE